MGTIIVLLFTPTCNNCKFVCLKYNMLREETREIIKIKSKPMIVYTSVS